MADDEDGRQGQQTISERENLMSDVIPKRTGFTRRSCESLATRRARKSMISIDCSHVARCSNDEPLMPGNKPLSYQMWLEAGKFEPPFPERPDPNYNSNVWRNFSKAYGFHTKTDGKSQKVGEMIAAMYPLNIPAPSKVGRYSYAKYLTETSVIKDPKIKKMAVERTTKDVEEFKRLRLRSDTRNPPIDKQGNIEPPVDFKHYVSRFYPPPEIPPDPPTPTPPGETRVDIFGKVVPRPKRQPFFWKLTYKLNNPEYEAVQQGVEEKRTAPRKYPPPVRTN